jgi:hypothetical protein
MGPRDRASAVARVVRQMVCAGASNANVAAYLRDEFTDVIREHVDEIQAFADQSETRRNRSYECSDRK